MLDFVEMTRTKPVNVRFIEFMPFDGNKFEEKKVVSYFEAKERILGRYPSLVRMKDHRSEVAKNYKVDGHEGMVSFVTSMTNHFCGGCNRLRIMADGVRAVPGAPHVAARRRRRRPHALGTNRDVRGGHRVVIPRRERRRPVPAVLGGAVGRGARARAVHPRQPRRRPRSIRAGRRQRMRRRSARRGNRRRIPGLR